ncbi:NADP-dependent oxidoreductase domain-containing protein [Lipomyces japonicus]|uniref:NADP-dependent oxidoreductase domain-containing protein n=1 Tax=Lipomyces japonicus TaxID=56871 RepID=UPI0034CE39A3
MVNKLLSDVLPPLVLGGGVFNTQMNDDPFNLPIADLIARAFDAGVTAIDTSPYYGESENLIGAALQRADIAARYGRHEYMLNTKVGRIAVDRFDYSDQWVRASVNRSMRRLGTDYLDVVYCHDVEFATPAQMLAAVGALFDLQSQGVIRFVGISGYPPDLLVDRVRHVVRRFGRPPDVVQSYCHFTLQNSKLARHLAEFKRAGVDVVINSSPLSMGLLSGSPAAAFHPAPQGLRDACMRAASHARDRHGMNLADLAARYAIGEFARAACRHGVSGAVVVGASYPHELESFVAAWHDVTVQPHGPCHNSDNVLDSYQLVFDDVQAVLGSWKDYSWHSGL